MDERICDKRGFSKKDAQTIVNSKKKALGKNKKEKRCYHCQFCNMWHLTSQDYEYKVTSSPIDLKYRDEWQKLLGNTTTR